MSETTPTALPRLPRYDPWASITETLRRHPGVWHTIRDDATTATTNINDGVLAAFRPAGDFEARRAAGVLEVRAVDDSVVPDQLTVNDRPDLSEDAPSVECIVCFGAGYVSFIGQPCLICNGAGVIR
jgi:hypothetical protein